MDLDKIKLFHSPLTDTIYLGREGKKSGVALDKRNAEADVMSVLVQHMMHEAPRGSVKTIALGGQQYEVSVKPIAPPHTAGGS